MPRASSVCLPVDSPLSGETDNDEIAAAAQVIPDYTTPETVAVGYQRAVAHETSGGQGDENVLNAGAQSEDAKLLNKDGVDTSYATVGETNVKRSDKDDDSPDPCKKLTPSAPPLVPRDDCGISPSTAAAGVFVPRKTDSIKATKEPNGPRAVLKTHSEPMVNGINGEISDLSEEDQGFVDNSQGSSVTPVAKRSSVCPGSENSKDTLALLGTK